MESHAQITVAINGFGNVGRALLQSLLQFRSVPLTILVYDVDTSVAGSILDLRQAAAIEGFHAVFFNTYDMRHTARVIFHSAGKAIPKGQSRDAMLHQNIITAQHIYYSWQFHPDAVIVNVTNPVEPMCAVLSVITGLSPNRVIGVGTQIETGRLRFHFSNLLNIGFSRIHTMVVGEHGDAMVPLLSQCTIDGVNVRLVLDDFLIQDCVYETRMSAQRIKGSGAVSCFAAATAAANLLFDLAAGSVSAHKPATVWDDDLGAFCGLVCSLGRFTWHAEPIEVELEEARALRSAQSLIFEKTKNALALV
ncbi:MAG: hypothetical protein Kow0075_04880 [Salibacteraceae bacterium]